MIFPLPCVPILSPVQNNCSGTTDVTEVSVALLSATCCTFPERLYMANISEGILLKIKVFLTFVSRCILFYCEGQNDGFLQSSAL